MIRHVINDGGRKAAGFKGKKGDCVTRAVAIASGRPYREVWETLAAGNYYQRERKAKREAAARMMVIKRGKLARVGQDSADFGIQTHRKWFKDYMRSLGFTWTACMGIGTGCKVHLRKDELPAGRLVVSLSRHVTAVIDGELHDNYDCSRHGTRCVYGYWSKA